MKSDTLIHEITADYGDDRHNELRRELLRLRFQIKREVISKHNNAIKLIELMYKP